MGVETQKAILWDAIKKYRDSGRGTYAIHSTVRILISEAQAEATAALSLKLARCEAERQWRPIETAPKGTRNKVQYILISDGIVLADLVIWNDRIPERVIDGNLHLARPEGWFCVSGGRSRLDGKATRWLPLPDPPTARVEAGEGGE